MAELPEYEYRKRCIEEKGKKCTVCNDDGKIVVHHVDGDRTNNSIDNLIPVCHPCHGKIHAGRPEVKKWSKRLGKPISSGKTTTIKISKDVWNYLHSKRTEPGVTFDDVIQRQLGIEDGLEVSE